MPDQDYPAANESAASGPTGGGSGDGTGDAARDPVLNTTDPNTTRPNTAGPNTLKEADQIRERLDAISTALARMVRRQTEIEARLQRIEAALPASAIPANLPPAIPAAPAQGIYESEYGSEPIGNTPPPLPRPVNPQPQLEPQPQPPGLTRPPADPALETRFGLSWVNRVAVVTLILGVAFFFKYAIDNEWIGPGLRVALGLSAATLALVAGEWMEIRKQRIFAQGMTGLGLALLYLSFYATFGFYHLLPQSVAFGLMTLTTVGAGWMAMHYDAQPIAILGQLGGFLTPVVLSSGEDHPWVLAAYTLLLNCGMLGLVRSRRSQGSWNAIAYLSAFGTYLLYSGWQADWLGPETRVPGFVWLTSTFAILLVAARYTTPSLMPLNAAAYFAGTYELLRPTSVNVAAFTLVQAAVHAAYARWLSQHATPTSPDDTHRPKMAAGIAVALLTIAIPVQFKGYTITILWSVGALALAWLSGRLASTKLRFGSLAVFALVVLRLLGTDLWRMEDNWWNPRLLAFLVASGCLWMASRFIPDQAEFTYIAGHILALIGLGREVIAWAERTAEPQNVSNTENTALTILMAGYAAALVGLGVGMRSALNRVLGLILLALVVAKLYLIDVWSLSRGFRITAFLGLGGLLLLVSYLYSRFRLSVEQFWRRSEQAETGQAIPSSDAGPGTADQNPLNPE
jgi:uncharacterized membrane protein